MVVTTPLLIQGETIILTGSASGGVPPYTWLWSNGGTNQSISVSPETSTNYTLTAFDDNGCSSMDYILVELQPIPITDTVFLTAGWNGLSSYVIPTNPLIADIFQPGLDELTILLNNSGQLYWPDQDINTIVNWNSHNGYMIKTTGETEILFSGMEETWKSLNVLGGWNLIPVLSACNVNVETLFDGTDPAIVKEVAGSNIYWPDYGINTLVNLHSGNSYYVKMNAGGVITFPECTLPLTTSNSRNDKTGNGGTPLLLKEKGWGMRFFFPGPIPPPSNITHTIALPLDAFHKIEIQPGDFLGAFNEMESCFGIVEFSKKNTAITLFGNDPITNIKDGFDESEEMQFKWYISDDNAEVKLDVEYDFSLSENDGQFTNNGLSAIKILKEDPASIIYLSDPHIEIFPNPTSGKLSITFSGITGPIAMEITNIHGDALFRKELILNQESEFMIMKDLSAFRREYFSSDLPITPTPSSGKWW